MGVTLTKFLSIKLTSAGFIVPVLLMCIFEINSLILLEKTAFWSKNTLICNTFYVMKNVYPWWHITLTHHYFDSYIWLGYVFFCKLYFKYDIDQGKPPSYRVYFPNSWDILAKLRNFEFFSEHYWVTCSLWGPFNQ